MSMACRSRRFSRRSGVAGFSLIEVLVAMTLTGLVLGALAMLTSQWLPNWQRGLTRVQQSELLGLALDRMADDLAAAEFVPANRETKRPLFVGSPTSVVFVRTALGPNARPGLEIVQLAQTSEVGGSGLARSTAPYAPRPARAGAPPFGPPAELLRGAYGITFSYAGRNGVWHDSWAGSEGLPRAVRLVVRDARTGKALDVSTAVVIRAEVPAACVTETERPVCGAPRPAGATGAAETGDDGVPEGGSR